MTNLTSTQELTWYIQTSTGLIGPFTSQNEASLQNIHEGHAGQVVSRTQSGQDILLG